MKKQRIKSERSMFKKHPAEPSQQKTLSGEKGKKKMVSIRYKIMLLCLLSACIVIMSIAVLILPQVTKIETNNTTLHMNDFITAQSKQIMNQVNNMKQMMNNIEVTSTATMGKTSALDPYKQITREMKVYAQQNQLNNDYAVMVNEDKKIVASTKESYVGLDIDDNLYQAAYATGDEVKMNTILDEKSGKLKLVISYRVLLKEQEVELNTNDNKGNKSEDTSESTDTSTTTNTSTSSDSSGSTSTDGTDGEAEAEKQVVRTEVMFYFYVSNETIQQELMDFTLNGIPDPQLYIIDSNGTMIASSNESLIGQKTDNAVLQKLTARLQNGETLSSEAGYGKYEQNGEAVGVSYIYMPDTNWIMAVTALDKEVYSAVHTINTRFSLSCIASILFAGVVIYIVTYSFSKPIQGLNQVIGRIADLDFTIHKEDSKIIRIVKRNDEIGAIGRSVIQMITVIKDKLNVVNESSIQMNQSAKDLQEITNEISEKASDTSAITEQISAGMQETTASTEVIAADINELKTNVIDMKKQIADGAQFADVIIRRAETLKQESEKAEESTRTLFGNIKERGQQAMEQSKAVKQIDEFAQVIESIASQTSLLALNASIEAARAGEAGRGFSVVAQEIGSLAQQSSDTVRKITDMVQEVNKAVSNITNCLNTSQEFVENNVYGDYENMQEILKNYGQDVQSIYDMISKMDANATVVEKTMYNITDSVQAINQTVQESAIGIADIAARNSSIGEKTADSYKMVSNTEEIAKELRNSVEVFKL